MPDGVDEALLLLWFGLTLFLLLAASGVLP